MRILELLEFYVGTFGILETFKKNGEKKREGV
jgi:hypothetical protein